jgi:hypothetical protein
MNLGGLAILFLVVCGGIAGLFLVMSKANMAAPVDSSGNTTPLSENLTRDNVTATSPIITSMAGGIALIVGGLIMFAVVVYFVGARHGYQGRYQ